MTNDDLQRETTDVLQQLVRFNTVNPPGNERPAIEYLEQYLQQAGFRTEVLATVDERPNLIADLDGDEEGPTAPEGVWRGGHGAWTPGRVPSPGGCRSSTRSAASVTC